MTRAWRVSSALMLLWWLPTAAAQAQSTSDLKRMSLQDLMDLEITTFSRDSERTSDVPAAVHVITQDDIRRSGATSLPEALRLAPGIQVSRLDASRYAIGIRGFPDRLSRAVLVMIDGRVVYSPLFAGTYWEVQDTLFEDIDRIEVIRGPGGTLWGPNAVNGIINVITKPSADTQGVIVSATMGSRLVGPFSARLGGAIGESLRWRAYAKGRDVRPQFRQGGPDYDHWRMVQGGLRADWTLDQNRTLTVQGDTYTATQGQQLALASFTPPFSETLVRRSTLTGGNLLARFSGDLAQGQFHVQTYYDRTTRDERPVREVRDTFDLYFQHRPRPAARNDFIWGASSRITSSTLDTVGLTTFTPAARTDGLHGVFAQDDISLVPARLRLVVGGRLDHNAYSAWEFQPTARAMWTLTERHSLIGAVTRAVRTPSQVEHDYATTSVASPAQPAFVRLQPNTAFGPERVTAYELGYRGQPHRTAQITMSSFYNRLDDVLSTELLTPFVETTPPPARVILPVTFANGLHGDSRGFELTTDWRPTAWLRTSGSYSFARIRLTRSPGSADVSQERRGEGLTPHHQAQVQTSVDAPHALQFDWMWRYVSALPAGAVPSYSTSDVRVSWQPRRHVEVAIVGQNLHDAHHLEWPSGLGPNVEIRRSVYASLTWRK